MLWILQRNDDLTLDLMVNKDNKILKINKTKIENDKQCFDFISQYGKHFDAVQDGDLLFVITKPAKGIN
jgi:hypothetical protein